LVCDPSSTRHTPGPTTQHDMIDLLSLSASYYGKETYRFLPLLSANRCTHACPSSGPCLRSPRSRIVQPSHLRVSHDSPGLSRSTNGWRTINRVSTLCMCASCSANRSGLSEWPSRIVNGVMIVRISTCMSASCVVLDSSEAADTPNVRVRLSLIEAHNSRMHRVR
jgi:hypothetical protein